MANLSANQLKSLIAASLTMLKAAEAGDWEHVIELEAQRRPQMDQFSTSLKRTETSDIDADELRHSIEQLIQLDQQIMALGQAVKDEVANKLGDMNTARQATSAYQNNKALK